MRILEELWYGNVNDSSRFLKYNVKLTEMLNLLSRNADTLMENLSEKEKEKETFVKFSTNSNLKSIYKNFKLELHPKHYFQIIHNLFNWNIV